MKVLVSSNLECKSVPQSSNKGWSSIMYDDSDSDDSPVDDTKIFYFSF